MNRIGHALHRGFTLVELSVAIMIGMMTGAMVLALFNQQLAFLKIYQAQNFLTEDAPIVSLYVSRLVGKADRFRLHDTVANALAGTNPRLTPSPVVVMNFRQPDGTMRASILSFEDRGAGLALYYYVVPVSGVLSAPTLVYHQKGEQHPVCDGAGRVAHDPHRTGRRANHLFGNHATMILSSTKRRTPGFVSYVLVLTTGAILTLLMVMTYSRAMSGQTVQNNVQLRQDYSEKEDAILRSIVSITPNRAIRAMQTGSNSNATMSEPLRWQNIFTEALVLANARTSIPSNVQSALNITNLKLGNSGDSALATPSTIFKAITPETGYVSVGINRTLGTGFPPPLTTNVTNTKDRDLLYPIISADKVYGTLAQTGLNLSGYGLPVATYPNFNLLTYPRSISAMPSPATRLSPSATGGRFRLNVAAQDYDSNKAGAAGA